jgi:hypothetical protein
VRKRGTHDKMKISIREAVHLYVQDSLAVQQRGWTSLAFSYAANNSTRVGKFEHALLSSSQLGFDTRCVVQPLRIMGIMSSLRPSSQRSDEAT